MCWPLVIAAAGAVVSAKGAADQAQAQKDALGYQAQVSANNAQYAEWQAEDAEQQGVDAEAKSRQQTAQLKGTQRAALAANGVSLGGGSALDILAGTDYMGEQDALTIRDNAARQAWGYRTQGQNYVDNSGLLATNADKISPSNAAGTSLLTSAARYYGASGMGAS
ncbi:hypothetical protein CAL26_09995 [Bordetella genomosp. 9]|uniref:Phage protein n=1 Tax=Bordetella genomosp. 9 TaxID=1416803 RepID=A0A261RGF1_9BORD|nr:hypothetical protein [Bordetella genomosp. 9]OZI23752.1 hypothetical protein CAL26_09995 [Bordetella genomosp. 9]